MHGAPPWQQLPALLRGRLRTGPSSGQPRILWGRAGSSSYLPGSHRSLDLHSSLISPYTITALPEAAPLKKSCCIDSPTAELLYTHKILYIHAKCKTLFGSKSLQKQQTAAIRTTVSNKNRRHKVPTEVRSVVGLCTGGLKPSIIGTDQLNNTEKIW